MNLPDQPRWMADALCAQVGDVELWHPHKGASTGPALAVCHECPVTADCLAWVLAIEARPGVIPVGIYGGTTVKTRDAIRRGGATVPCAGCDVPVRAHAGPGGRRTPQLCRPCRDARRRAQQAAYDATRARCAGCGNKVRADMPCPHCLLREGTDA